MKKSIRGIAAMAMLALSSGAWAIAPYIQGDKVSGGTAQSAAAAVEAVRENLAAGAGKASKVYEVVLPERQLAVFGVGMAGTGANDAEWIRKIGMQESVAGLPYEIYIVGGKVSSPHGRYRIALAFPDVTMSQFMRISNLPTSIIETMDAVAGAEKSADESNSWGQ